MWQNCLIAEVKNLYQGFLKGLKHKYEQPIQYQLSLGENDLCLNDYLSKRITLTYLQEIRCINCQKKIRKSYNQGFCYPCFMKLPENDLCIVKPHECHFHQGTCRDEQFAETHCMIPHYVYLAISSGIKVGLTRKGNELKRWTDQGAVQAIPIAELPTRKLAGELEFSLSQHVKDKTDWRKMLKGEVEAADLMEIRKQILQFVPEPFLPYLLDEQTIYEFVYPVLNVLDKIKTYDLEKEQHIEDCLIGIKGNYLIFEKAVLNVKKYSGYKIALGLSS